MDLTLVTSFEPFIHLILCECEAIHLHKAGNVSTTKHPVSSVSIRYRQATCKSPIMTAKSRLTNNIILIVVVHLFVGVIIGRPSRISVYPVREQ